jgi:hypothetical protein
MEMDYRQILIPDNNKLANNLNQVQLLFRITQMPL